MAARKKKAKKTKSKKKSKEFIDDLKQFVRSKGVEFLKNENTTSVGIGYKETDGKITDEISIQFSVEDKLEPEALELESYNSSHSRIIYDQRRRDTDRCRFKENLNLIMRSLQNPKLTVGK